MSKKITMAQIKSLREKTSAPVMQVKKALIEAKGDEKKATAILKKKGHEKAAKRADRETKQGIIATYVHHNQKVVGIVELLSETDFVARNDLFVNTANDLAMQVASMNPKDVKEFKNQDFIKDPKKKISDLVKDVIAKTGENIRIGRIYRMELGK